MQKAQQDYNSCVLALEKLINKLKPPTSTSERSSIVALYTADDEHPLRFSGKIGILQLDFDRRLKNRLFRFYDIDSLDLLFQVELFFGFADNYRECSHKNLYVFDFFHNGNIGFEFRNKEEAEKMLVKVKSSSPKMDEFRQLQKQKIKKQLQARESHSFFGKLKQKWHTFKGDAPEQPKHQSKIIQVEKKRSISFNFETGEFDLANIPQEWQEIFDAIGLKKKHLKNKKVMEFVFEEALIHQAKKADEEDPDKVSHERMTFMKKQRQSEYRESDVSSLKSSIMTCDFEKVEQCLPPPPPDLTLPVPPPISPELMMNSEKLPQPQIQKQSSTSRADLMQQIRNNKLKLKPVKATDKRLQIDASNMNKQQRKDLAQQIRLKLQRRKIALSKVQASDSDSYSD